MVADIDDRRYVAQAVRWLQEERFADLPWPAAAVQPEPIRRKIPEQVSDERWRERLTAYRDAGAIPSRDWPREFGLPPSSNASRVPKHLRREFGWL